MKKRLSFFLLSATLFVLPFLADADIYKYVDQHGRVHLTDRPSHSGYKRLVKTWKGWQEAKVDYRNVARNRKKYEPAIAGAAKANRLPEALLHAVITAESAYDPDAVSSAGAVGLMQLMPATAQRYGVGNRRDPNANVSGGTRYLRDLLDLFDNNVVLALAAYNAGENAVIKHGRRIPPYAETQTYVRRVLKYYNEYKKQM
ncbi:MAG: lytic transglycosylase domain-containing protein [Gammaproteobacteria bacterium]|nr:lytic transglycosylase domain-containing protein [Gammaproteobacteria bacterium]MCP5201337.1 lytic transglycosylase domain-containing protein [Gammaproteobacteria bacterium]